MPSAPCASGTHRVRQLVREKFMNMYEATVALCTVFLKEELMSRRKL